jgi:hypothetical protein
MCSSSPGTNKSSINLLRKLVRLGFLDHVR